MRVLITTTIGVPFNLAEWRRAGFTEEDVFIVAGDQKTPHDSVVRFLDSLPGKNIYLHPKQQEKWRISEVMGWNVIQRRNIALLQAMALQPEWIITVDDDNYPTDSRHALLVDDLMSGVNDNYSTVRAASGWFNVGGLLKPYVTHRGYPLSRRHEEPRFIMGEGERRVGVVASLWLGAPDIDAVERIATDPWVHEFIASQSVVLERGTWCPFNSQATAFHAELAPLMAVWPFVGRYDDIWASYLARTVMDNGTDCHVLYGHPIVFQDRNPHNLVLDLEREMLGYAKTDELVDVLRNNRPATLSRATKLLSNMSWLPDELHLFFESWLEDLKFVGVVSV